jgi:hypothetical protein
MRAALVGVFASLAALGISVAAPAEGSKPGMLHLAQLTKMYSSDHHGAAPASQTDLLPYSTAFERLIGACTISSGDLTQATMFMAGQVRSLGGQPFTSLAMMQAFNRRVHWTTPRDCWNPFIAAETGMENSMAASRLRFKHEVTALYVFDHNGAQPSGPVALLPYGTALGTIADSCTISPEDATNLMFDLSDKASSLGARTVTTLMMLKAIVRRIDWHGQKINCTPTFDNAEGHMENGGP